MHLYVVLATVFVLTVVCGSEELDKKLPTTRPDSVKNDTVSWNTTTENLRDFVINDKTDSNLPSPSTVTPTASVVTTTPAPTTTTIPSTTTILTTTTAATTTTSKSTTTIKPLTTKSSTTTTTTTTTTSTTTPTTDPAHTKGRRFDGPSFVGGIILASGLLAIGFISWKFYKARTERNYHTL